MLIENLVKVHHRACTHKIGGNIIFFFVIGFFAALKRRNITPTAIQTAMTLDKSAIILSTPIYLNDFLAKS